MNNFIPARVGESAFAPLSWFQYTQHCNITHSLEYRKSCSLPVSVWLGPGNPLFAKCVSNILQAQPLVYRFLKDDKIVH